MHGVPMSLPCDAMILCAGLGTRLRPLTLERAKPAVPLLHRPLVGYALALLHRLGVERVVVNTHWRAETMVDAVHAEAERLGMGVRVSHEPEVLGTGGALRRARDLGLAGRGRPLLVINGDVLFDVDLAAVLETHVRSGAAATMVLRPLPEGSAYSSVESDDDGRIRRIARVGAPPDPRRRRSLFTGVHVLSPETLALIPPGVQGVVETLYAGLLEIGAPVQSVSDASTWLDLGDPTGYLDANLSLLDGTLPLPRLAATGVLADAPAAIHPEARIGEDAVIVRSVVGANARIGAGARLRNCVVWDGARVDEGEELANTVVARDTRVAVPVH